MGATFAPNYACLFLGLWEEKLIWGPSNIHRDNIIWYGRYIDDLIFFYSGDLQSLKSMHTYLNSTSDSVELSLEYSHSEIHFLDLKSLNHCLGIYIPPSSVRTQIGTQHYMQ